MREVKALARLRGYAGTSKPSLLSQAAIPTQSSITDSFFLFFFLEWLHPERFERDLTGKAKYIKVCEEMGISPTSYFIKHIQDRELKMKFHGLGPLRMRALAVPLEVSILLT